MKDINNYVCTLEQAKRLKDLGVEQSPVFGFYVEYEGNIYKGMHFETHEDMERRSIAIKHDAAAFTSQELGEMISKLTAYWTQKYAGNGIVFSYSEYCEECKEYYEEDNYPDLGYLCYPESQARADFLIYLLNRKNSLSQIVTKWLSK